MAYDAGFQLNFDVMKELLTKGLARERHLAKFLRQAIYIHFRNEPDEIKNFLEKLFNGKALKSLTDNYAGVENEIRGNLLKSGGAAFVVEDPKAFLPLEDVRRIILAAGGIPTYPFLADDANGQFTDFEQDIVHAAEILKRRGFYSAEFITTRNSIETLEKYAGYLYDNGFVVTFGSEHNTPAMEPVELFARGKTPLTEKLKQINYEGACVVAAHQALVKEGKEGYVDKAGVPDIENRSEFIKKGDELIRSV